MPWGPWVRRVPDEEIGKEATIQIKDDGRNQEQDREDKRYGQISDI